MLPRASPVPRLAPHPQLCRVARANIGEAKEQSRRCCLAPSDTQPPYGCVFSMTLLHKPTSGAVFATADKVAHRELDYWAAPEPPPPQCLNESQSLITRMPVPSALRARTATEVEMSASYCNLSIFNRISARTRKSPSMEVCENDLRRFSSIACPARNGSFVFNNRSCLPHF